MIKEKLKQYSEIIIDIDNQNKILKNNLEFKNKENIGEDKRVIALLQSEKNELAYDILKYISQNLESDNFTKEQLSNMYKIILDMKFSIETIYNK